MGKEIITQVQETQRVPNRINPRWNTPRYILIKLTKIKHKEQILKAAREKQQITHKGSPIRITADLSIIADLLARREWQDIKWWKKIAYSPDYCMQQGSPSNMKQKSKALQTSKNWENFPTNAKGSSLDRKHKKGVETRTLINDYIKRKWVECPNQKTKTGWMDTKTRPLYIDCLQETHLKTGDTYRLKVKDGKNIPYK